ncbi:MAG: helix-turn-helix domain-containing protein [Gemmatimonadales bacterium]
MLVLAAVPSLGLHRLRAVDSDHYDFVAVGSWIEVVEIIRRRPVEMAVVDPILGGRPRVREIERLRVLFPSLPLLLYTTLAPETAGILLQLGSMGIRRAIFSRFDDAPTSLHAALQAELETSASRRVLQSLAGALDGLPARLRYVVETALHVPADTMTVDELARRAQVKRRTCERWFARSALPSPRTVLMLARLLYAHRLLLDPGYTVEDVTLKLGYGKTRTLQLQLKEVFGLTAGEFRLSLSIEEAVAIVTARYFPRLKRAAS